jgi:hypothetical protein
MAMVFELDGLDRRNRRRLPAGYCGHHEQADERQDECACYAGHMLFGIVLSFGVADIRRPSFGLSKVSPQLRPVNARIFGVTLTAMWDNADAAIGMT